LLFWWLSVDSTKRADSLDSYQFATTTTPANHQALISKALTMQTGPLSNIKKKQKKKKHQIYGVQIVDPFTTTLKPVLRMLFKFMPHL